MKFCEDSECLCDLFVGAINSAHTGPPPKDICEYNMFFSNCLKLARKLRCGPSREFFIHTFENEFTPTVSQSEIEYVRIFDSIGKLISKYNGSIGQYRNTNCERDERVSQEE